MEGEKFRVEKPRAFAAAFALAVTSSADNKSLGVAKDGEESLFLTFKHAFPQATQPENAVRRFRLKGRVSNPEFNKVVEQHCGFICFRNRSPGRKRTAVWRNRRWLNPEDLTDLNTLRANFERFSSVFPFLPHVLSFERLIQCFPAAARTTPTSLNEVEVDTRHRRPRAGNTNLHRDDFSLVEQYEAKFSATAATSTIEASLRPTVAELVEAEYSCRAALPFRPEAFRIQIAPFPRSTQSVMVLSPPSSSLPSAASNVAISDELVSVLLDLNEESRLTDEVHERPSAAELSVITAADGAAPPLFCRVRLREGCERGAFRRVRSRRSTVATAATAATAASAVDAVAAATIDSGPSKAAATTDSFADATACPSLLTLLAAAAQAMAGDF